MDMQRHEPTSEDIANALQVAAGRAVANLRSGMAPIAQQMQRAESLIHADLAALARAPEVRASLAKLHQALGVVQDAPDPRSRVRRLWDAACDRLRR